MRTLVARMAIPACVIIQSAKAAWGANIVTAGPPLFAERTLWNIARDRLHWLDVGRPDHLAPLLGFAGDELAQFGRRHRHRRPAEFDETCLKLGIGQARIDLPVQRGGDLGPRVPGLTDAEPYADAQPGPTSPTAGTPVSHR